MLVSVVSDVHGNIDGLKRAADEAELLVVLGDLLEYVDYYEPSNGILGLVFGPAAVATLANLRTAGNFAEMHAYDRQLWGSLAAPAATLEEIVRDEYQRFLDVLPSTTLVTLGNVDQPAVWDAMVPADLRHRDGETVDVDGIRLGFVAGGSLKVPDVGSPWTYYERTPNDYRAALDLVGRVDVLCTHVPPDIPDLRFDTAAQRPEMYGPGLLEAIESLNPALALSGHVHHPRLREVVHGSTRCVNVGYFKRNPTPFVVNTGRLGS